MKKCPKCGNFSIDYDTYKGVFRCMIDGCSCIVIDENTYSYLKADPSKKMICRIKVEQGRETKVIKEYSMA